MASDEQRKRYIAGWEHVWHTVTPREVAETMLEKNARITALEEAVRLLADECYAWRTHTEENYYTNALRSAKNTDANPIAAEAVRKAGG